MRVIVIGGVAAGMSAASKLRRADPKAEIAVYERGSFLSYGACGLPYYIGGWNEDPQKLIARTPEKFREMGIETHLRHEVLRVDAARKTVTVRDLDSGREFEDRWDRLMIAVGCRSAAPPVPGYDLPAVFSLRSMEDGLLLHEIARLPGVRHAVIVGGGAIGVEMAEALTRLGKRITLLEGAERLLRPFEPEFSELAARELERNGVTLRLNSRLQAIEEKGDHRLVRTEKEEIACDLVLMAAGIRPETAFLKETGIRMARNGAILVDREMRTSLPDVYASCGTRCSGSSSARASASAWKLAIMRPPRPASVAASRMVWAAMPTSFWQAAGLGAQSVSAQITINAGGSLSASGRCRSGRAAPQRVSG